MTGPRLPIGQLVDVLALVVLGVWFRALGLQSSRFIGDDQWVIAASNTDGGVGEIVRFGHTNPGFHLLVRVFSGGNPAGSSASFVVPAFLAGILGIGVAYGVALRLSSNRLVAFLAGAVVALSAPHATYSLRVKTYTIVVLVGFGLFGWLASRDRRPAPHRPSAVSWGRFVAGLALYFVALTMGLWIAVYALAALIAVHVVDDDPTTRRWIRRSVAVGGPLSGAWYLFVTSNYGVQAFRDQFSSRGFLIPDEGLLHRPSRTITHFVRTTRVLTPDVSTTVSAVIAVILAIAVVHAIVRRNRASTLTAALVALAGAGAGFMGVMPYGVSEEWERLDLWLLPAYLVLLVGLVVDAVDRVEVARLPKGRAAAAGATALAVAAVFGLLQLSDRPAPPNSATSAEFMNAVEAEYEVSTHLLYPSIRVLLALDAYSDVIPVDLVADDSPRGSRPVPADPSVVTMANLPPAAAVPDARIVLPSIRSFRSDEVEVAENALREAGYVKVAEASFGRWDEYSIWQTPSSTLGEDR